MPNHNFAQQVLKQFGISIYAGGNKILDSVDISDYPLQELKTEFILHKHISITNKAILKLTQYEDVLRLGFIISRKRPANRSYQWQHFEYFLVKTTSGNNDLGKIPQDHEVEYNIEENWIRLVGRFSSGKKVYIHSIKKTNREKELELEDFAGVYDDYIAEISPFTYQEEEEKKLIKEIPWILTDDGRLVCFPQTKDLPKIGVFGSTGRGKTMFIHYFTDCIYWKWKKRLVVGNDGVGFQTKSWSLPWNPDKDNYFLNWMNIIGHKTIPLPCVYLFPNTDNLSEADLENVGHKIALPFRDIMASPSQFFKDIEKLGLSEKYLHGLIYDDEGNIRPDGLYYVDSIKQIHDLINEQVVVQQEMLNNDGFPERKMEYKIGSDNTRGKFNALFKEVWNSKIFDVNTNVPSKWIIQTKDGQRNALYPWRACLYSDVPSVLVTSNIRNKKYFAPAYRFILDDLFNMQQEPLNKANQQELWMILDEIHSLLAYEIIAEKLRMIAKEGRPNRIALIYATQYFGDISEDIELNTDYIVSFQQTKALGKKILQNFDGLNIMLDSIHKLPKYHAIVAGKAGSPLVVYDTEGNREIVEDGTPFKGKIFPSVSQHSAPKSAGL